MNKEIDAAIEALGELKRLYRDDLLDDFDQFIFDEKSAQIMTAVKGRSVDVEEKKWSAGVEEIKTDLGELMCDSEWWDKIGDDLISDKIIDYLQSQGYLNSGWQPIESAPKDGTKILAASPHLIGIISFYEADPDYFSWVDETGEFIELEEEHIQHWQPLPQTPEDNKNE